MRREPEPLADDNRPRILVLMAAFNGARWIGEQIDSILRQRDVDVRIAVSDDGSTDATRSEVERFISTGRVFLTSPTSPTGSAAQNFLHLIRQNPAEGFQAVAFSDQDDLWEPDKLKRACQALTRGAAAGYSSAVKATWEDGRVSTLRQSSACTDADFLFEGAGQGCTFVLSAEFYDMARAFFIENRELTRVLYYHDWATYALSRVWGARWVFDAEPMVRYRQHGGNDTGARSSIAGMRKRLGRIASGWYRGQITAVMRLCLAADPHNRVVVAWSRVFGSPPGLARRLRVASFCFHRGRRRAIDNAMVVLAALAGHI